MKFGLLLSDLTGEQVTEIVKLLGDYDTQSFTLSPEPAPEPAPKPKPKPKPKSKPAPEPAPAPEPSILSIDSLRDRTLQLLSSGKKDKIVDIYKQFGISILTELDESMYNEYSKQIKELEADLN